MNVLGYGFTHLAQRMHETYVGNTICAASAVILFSSQQISIYLENGNFQVLKNLYQLQISLFRPITN